VALDDASYETYNEAMADMTVSEARDHFSEVVERARSEPVYLARHGRRAVVVVSAERYDALVEGQEDAEDIAAADAAIAEVEGGADTIPWEQVKADLGL
jgi:prevent-host-death family protein